MTALSALKSISRLSYLKNLAKSTKHSIDMNRVASIILAGGQGKRLFPLTLSQCKPAMCYGGRYRLIDIPISNAINSGCKKIFIVTQFLSSSLQKHILKTYRFDSFSSAAIELLPPEEKHLNRNWFQGTADAVRQCLDQIEETPADYFLILSGDQLYHMDFRDLIHFAQETDAEVVIASLPVNESDAKRMGILQIDKENIVTSFHEKPQHADHLDSLHISPYHQERFLIDPNQKLNFLGSMGIYLFKRKTLFDLLRNDPREDFGKHLLPLLVQKRKLKAYFHRGYWEDIGTIRSFYQANMDLVNPKPFFNCYNEGWRIFTHHTTLPGARIYNSTINQSILCEGTIIHANEIKNSIIGPRCIIHKGTHILHSYIMGNEFYEAPVATPNLPKSFEIGENCQIHNTIIDKHVCIGKNVHLINKNNLSHYDGNNIYIRDGIIVVPRGAKIANDFVL